MRIEGKPSSVEAPMDREVDSQPYSGPAGGRVRKARRFFSPSLPAFGPNLTEPKCRNMLTAAARR
jgi:hypothetical protein